jgi:N6-adenosine-specific RNA methylase IME4
VTNVRYPIIYADPAWRWKNWSSAAAAVKGEKWGRANGRAPYDCMDTADICALPVSDIAAKDCVLFCWATYPKLPDALQVIAAWGFTFKTCAFTWVKENPSGVGYKFGLGYWTRGNCEVCLLATRGKPKRVSNTVPQLVFAPVGEHSVKPAVVRERIVKLIGDLPRVELFARQHAEGWVAVGDHVDGLNLRESLARLAASGGGELSDPPKCPGSRPERPGRRLQPRGGTCPPTSPATERDLWLEEA